jgi:gentisate 1,2-dioxygenase
MVHYGDRRHRLNADEVPLVRSLVLEKLTELTEERRDLLQAEELYKVIHRMDHNRPGRPEYPKPLTWSYLEAYLEENGPLLEEDPDAVGVGGEEAYVKNSFTKGGQT